MKKEIWKDIKGYEWLYKISNLGRIMSKERYVKIGKGFRYKKENILADFLQNGYRAIVLWKEKRFKLKYIHRLVAEAFIKNDLNLKEVNHKDGNKQNNVVSNLEWCSRNDNIKHAVKLGLIKAESLKAKIIMMNNKVKRPVLQIKDGKIINEFESIAEASRLLLGRSTSNISSCCMGRLKTSIGFEWKYKN